MEGSLMQKVRIPQHVSTAFFEESAILLDSRENVYYSLNDSAAEFWKLLTEFESVKEALTQITKLYECSPETLEQDMKKLVVSLIDLGLLES